MAPSGRRRRAAAGDPVARRLGVAGVPGGRLVATPRDRSRAHHVHLQRDHRRPAPGAERRRADAVRAEHTDVVGAHAAAMVFSYLILAAMGLLEWRVLGTTGRARGGVLQGALLVL